jgi:outer membrane protein TolC
MFASFPLRHARRVSFAALFGLVLWLGAVPGWAQQHPLDFSAALERAQAAAPLIRARSAELTAAREEAARAGTLPDPQLIVGVDSLPITGPNAFEFGHDDMTMKKLGLMQEFPAAAKREAQRLVADRLVNRAQALAGVQGLEVREQVADAWLAAWVAKRERMMLDELRDQAALAVKLAEARLRGGTGTAVDAMAAKSAALDVENRIDAAQATLDSARASLARWLGVDADAVPQLGQSPDLSTLPIPEALLLATAGKQRQLIDWRSREDLAESRLQEAIAGRRPDWSVMAAYGQRDDGRDDMLMLEFRVALPLFPGNRQDRGIAARRAEMQGVSAEREDAERAQLETVRKALAAWRGLRGQVDRHETQILPLARDRAQAALASYRAGGPLQPWLDARSDELEAHLMHSKHLGELAQVWASLAYLLPEEAAQ